MKEHNPLSSFKNSEHDKICIDLLAFHFIETFLLILTGAPEVSTSNREASVELIKLDISRTFPQLCIFQKVRSANQNNLSIVSNI